MIRTATFMAVVSAFIASVLGDVPEGSQCGGSGYTGSTVCQSPYVCMVSNANGFAQCLPAPATTTTVPTPTPSYVPLWGECGGIGYTGSTFCQPPYVCQSAGVGGYSQCIPPATTTMPPTTTTTTTSSAPSTTPSYVPIWGECGGIGYTGSTVCQPPNVCQSTGIGGYSQCIPATTTTTTVPTPTDTSNPYYNHKAVLDVSWRSEITADANADPIYSYVYGLAEAIPSFLWLNQTSNIAILNASLASASPNQLVQVVIYNLPDRNCAHFSDLGEFSYDYGGAVDYQNFIDQIATSFKAYSNVRVVAILEPNSVASLVAYPDKVQCEVVGYDYMQSLQYALEKFGSISTVYTYIDAGNVALISTSDLRNTLASTLNELYNNSGSPAGVRGLATNVGNYNAFITTSPDPIFAGNAVNSEWEYIQALGPLLSLPKHFIVDTSRNGQQNIRQSLSDWCNVRLAAFGIAPTSQLSQYTGNSTLVDALAWVKNAGESDGTSNPSSLNYDLGCTASTSFTPAPEYGGWISQYFYTLVWSANPSLVPANTTSCTGNQRCPPH